MTFTESNTVEATAPAAAKVGHTGATTPFRAAPGQGGDTLEDTR